MDIKDLVAETEQEKMLAGATIAMCRGLDVTASFLSCGIRINYDTDNQKFININAEYRLKPEPKPEIPDYVWQALDKKWNFIAWDNDGSICAYMGDIEACNGFWVSNVDSADVKDIFNFASFDYKNHWRNSLVERPEQFK